MQMASPDPFARVARVRRAAELWFFRVAASGLVPARWFLRDLPPEGARAARTGRLSVEIASHCWQYSHLLAYQLSSLVLHPPTRVAVTMTVFYAAEDADTVALLRYFEARRVPGVRWNWCALDKTHLLRRSIGRNRAARATECDWIWFTDCDTLFHEGCLDALGDALQGRRDTLVFPEEEHCSALLPEDDPLLTAARGRPAIVEIDASRFAPQRRGRATGPYQITHGDVARACGYCDGIAIYQTPADRWQKAHEDRAYRWLLRTDGVAISVPGAYRIRHASKGRYQGNRVSNRLRAWIRRAQARVRRAGGSSASHR